jgi:GTPase Era involved in 16S rRNA processing
MQESLDLFSETINSKWFVDTPVILFMNKTDLFKEKVGRSPISAMFPEYSGPQEHEASLEYIKKKFCEKSRYPDKKILCVPTSATDTESLQKAFETIKETLTSSKPSTPVK